MSELATIHDTDPTDPSEVPEETDSERLERIELELADMTDREAIVLLVDRVDTLTAAIDRQTAILEAQARVVGEVGAQASELFGQGLGGILKLATQQQPG